MNHKARNYTSKTLKRLFALSGNQCAFSGCQKKMVNSNNAKDSNICHIEAASEGGERYRHSMSDPERADYPNLILLCVQHHDETNDIKKFSVDILKDMKQNHESAFLHQKLSSNPSMLRNTINAIASMDFEYLSIEEGLTSFDPKEKITHNSVKRHFALIQEYKAYHKKLNSLYDELESQGSLKKEKILNNIKLIYLKVKGSYILDSNNIINSIRENSDNIIDDVYSELYSKLEDSGFWDEDVIFGINLVLVDAFLRCKILEEPPKNDSE